MRSVLERNAGSRQGVVRQRLLVVVVATVAAAAGWATFEVALGQDLRAPAMGGSAGMDIGLVAVVISVALAGLAAWGSLAVLERWVARARLAWTILAVAVFMFSLGGPFGGEGVDAAGRWMLATLHVVAASILIPGLARTAPRAGER